MPEFGIEPIVYCPENANYLKTDTSLERDVSKSVTVLRTPVNDVSKVAFKRNSKNAKGVANSTNNKFLSFIRGNFFIPDAKVLWVKPSVKFLSQYLEKNSIDVIITTGPPHSMHLIGMELKRKFKMPWLADFRDPWTDLYYNKEFYQLGFAKNRNSTLEKRVLKFADVVLTVGNHLKSYFQKFNPNVKVITNGFDTETEVPKLNSETPKFNISYIGLLPKSSVPYQFFSALEVLLNTNDEIRTDLELNFVGDIHQEVKDIVSKSQLGECTTFIDYVPHDQAIAYQNKAQILLLLIPNIKNNQGIITGKVFEYLSAGRPILAIGPTQGDLNDIIAETKSGIVVDHDNLEGIKSALIELYAKFKSNNLKVDSVNIEKYHRRNLTESLALVLKQMI